MPRLSKQKRDAKKQKLARRTGKVKRVEVVLVADSPRDQYIAGWMDDNLGRGEASEFVRQAIEEKIARELLGQDVDTPQHTVASEQVMMLYEELRDERQRASDQFEALIQEIHALRQQLQGFELKATRVTETVEISAPAAVQQSSGLDMSRPRPRKQLPRSAPAVEPATDVLSEADQVRLAKIMANSIKMAQPGRSEKR